MPFLKHPDAFKSLRDWMTSPAQMVGHYDTRLSALPRQIDTATQRGCKSQTFTSWACLQRSYVVGGDRYVGEQKTRAQVPPPEDQQIVAHFITKEKWKELPRNLYIKYKNAKVMMDRFSSELMTFNQIHEKYDVKLSAISTAYDRKQDVYRYVTISNQDLPVLQQETAAIFTKQSMAKILKGSSTTACKFYPGSDPIHLVLSQRSHYHRKN